MPTEPQLFIDCRNTLGEGPLWHHQRQQLFWFDILACTMYQAGTEGEILNSWSFDEPVSAAAIIDRSHVLVASASALIRFNADTGERSVVVDLDADNPGTRSNDGRADRGGRFWIGTMGRDAAKGAGGIWRFAGGKVVPVIRDISIPNAICFSPDGRTAYWADTPTKRIWCGEIDSETGEVVSDWSVFVDTTSHRGSPDGAVIDSQGYLWSARWGGSCVVRHAPDGSVDTVVELPVSNITCPAFGGDDLKTLYITTARENMTAEQLAAEPQAGSVFSMRVDVPGLPETPVIL